MEPEIIPGNPGEGQPIETSAPIDGGFQMPEKFAGKSAEEIAKAYSELEKEYGKKASQPSVDYNKIGELIENKLTSLRPSEPQDPTQVENENQQKEIARKLGLAFKEDVDAAREQGKREAQLERINESLTEKYNGKDGRPVYSKESVVEYAKQNGLTNLHPETVYKLMNEKALDDWKVAQALKGNRAPIVPKGGPKPTPGAPDVSKMNEDQRKAHIQASLEAGQYE